MVETLKNMAYANFTLLDLQKQFNLSNKIVELFDPATIRSIDPSPMLIDQLKEAALLPMRTEKARSELIIIPILMELRKRNNRFFTIYSGEILAVDQSQGLVGECDFILARDTGSLSINTPLINIIEAKREDLFLGINQCAAQLYGAYLLNQQLGTPIAQVYGCVTTADSWKFLCLQENLIQIDQHTYYKSEIDQILGVFQEIIDYYKAILK